MNIAQLIQELIDSGYSESRVASEVDCKTSQATIHRIKTGQRKSVRFDLGMAIIHLHQQVVCDQESVEPETTS